MSINVDTAKRLIEELHNGKAAQDERAWIREAAITMAALIAPEPVIKRTSEQVAADLTRDQRAGILGHPLHPYLESYRSMGSARVAAYTVATDIEKNMMKVTRAKPEQPNEAPTPKEHL